MTPVLSWDLLGDVDDVVHRHFALQHGVGQAFDEGVVIAGLSHELLVVEEHACLGVLRDAVGAVCTLYGVPQ